jgi:hypothetical protein
MQSCGFQVSGYATRGILRAAGMACQEFALNLPLERALSPRFSVTEAL